MLPPDGPDSAIRRRDLIETAGWLTAEGALARLELGANLSALRRQNRLLGVWYAESNTWYYPAFQFDSHAPCPQVAELLAILPRGNGSGWGEIEWLYSPHALTGSLPPVEFILSDPQRVLEAAREEYLSPPDTR